MSLENPVKGELVKGREAIEQLKILNPNQNFSFSHSYIWAVCECGDAKWVQWVQNSILTRSVRLDGTRQCNGCRIKNQSKYLPSSYSSDRIKAIRDRERERGER